MSQNFTRGDFDVWNRDQGSIWGMYVVVHWGCVKVVFLIFEMV